MDARRKGDATKIRGDYQYRALNEGPRIQRAWHRLKLGLLDEVWSPDPGQRVLDVGCGSGVFSRALRDRGAHVCAVDANEEAVTFAREHFAEDGLAFHHGLLDELGFGEGSFDAAVCLEVIEHVYPDQVEVLLGDLRRLLKPGGTLLLSTPNYRGLWPVWSGPTDRFGPTEKMHSAQHVSRFSRRKLRQALERNGFEPSTLRTYCTFAPFAAAISSGLSRALARLEARIDLPFGNLLVTTARVPAS
jgi:2-polyprenyl-3-methyl-5-hydroxy-6-metoxy-1,4-benzoquinol methylase